MSPVLYRKWRPRTLAEVVGQEPVTRTLLNALATGRVAHAYLFFGPRGTGKTSTGRILAKALNCLQNETGEPCNACQMCRAFNEGRAVDLIELDAASHTGVDNIRDLIEKASFMPTMGRYKVYIIDEVHMLSTSAFNALLKTLEEPPPHVIFILATTEVHKVPATITSRCQRFDLRRIPLGAMVERLQHICRAEGIIAEPEALALIARAATGSLRDAENLLEQMVVHHGLRIDTALVRQELGLTGEARVKDLARALLAADVPRGLGLINSAAADGLDLRQFNRELLEFLRAMLLIKSGAEEAAGLGAEETAKIKSLVSAVPLPEIARAIKLFAQADFRFAPQSTLPLELALVDYAAAAGPKAETAEAPANTIVPRPPVAERERPREEKPSEAPPAPFPAQRIPPPADDSPIEHIQKHWNDFIRACRGTPGQLDALLRGSCKPLAIEDNALVLGFFARSKFQKSKVEDHRYLTVLSGKLEEMFGKRYAVRCVLISEENRPPAPPLAQSRMVKEALDQGAQIINEEYMR